MALLPAPDRRRVANLWAREIFKAKTANLTITQILAAINGLDVAFESAASTGAQTVAQYLNSSLGAVFLAATTTPEVAVLLKHYAGVKWGGEQGGN